MNVSGLEPRSLSFRCGAFPGNRFVEWVLDLHLLVWGEGSFYRCRDGDLSLHDGTRCPSDSQWLEFWAAIDRLGVWEWEEVYEIRGMMDGGFTWSLEITHDDRSLRSMGRNARRPPSFWQFCIALGTVASDEALVSEARRKSAVSRHQAFP